MSEEIITCKDCKHWDRIRDYYFGVCTVKMGDKVDIECDGGWDGCVIGDVETEEDFYCATGESESGKKSPQFMEK